MKPPRHLETKFRKELGSISPYLSLIDIASKELIEHNDRSKISELSKRYGHKRLAVNHLDFNEIPLFVHLSHLAFIHSKAEKFCDEYKEHHKAIHQDKSSPNLKELDKLRRIIFHLHALKCNEPLTVRTISDDVYSNYAGEVELIIYDYYRRIRNIEFHGGLDRSELKAFSDLENKSIYEKYGYIPQKPENLSIRDVILYSKTWQSIAVNLCKNMVDLMPIIHELCTKYKESSEQRRDRAISNKLRTDYLQNEHDISKLRIQTNGWVA
ncbi:TPA: hypothetical protein RQK02_004670 [Vibrio vulnificus]|nr:hypothetical protein [Vibrio vulnificus]HDY7699798.1 hypothetical protein [Vibrio vulnificus]